MGQPKKTVYIITSCNIMGDIGYEATTL